MHSEENYNYKVVYELRDDLQKEELDDILKYIEELSNKFNIISIDKNSYRRRGNNINANDDFGDVVTFYHVLGDKKEYMKKLELYKIKTGQRYVEV